MLKESSGFTSFPGENDIDDEKMYVVTEDSKNEKEEVIERSWIGMSEREKVLEMAS